MTDSTKSILQQHSSEEGTMLVIDGDAIPYMIGWHHREHQDIPTVKRAIDTWFSEFLTLAGAGSYIGILAADNSKCFRYGAYNFKPYKGNRGEKDEWIAFWEPYIRNHLVEKHGFVKAAPHLETDDVVAALGLMLPYELTALGSDRLSYICSPDKDLKQIPGRHLNYRKVGEAGGGILQDEVTASQAQYNWCMQMLMGDTTDNIAGIPGLGDKKAKELLDKHGEMMWMTTVRMAYQKYFGPHYGQIIYAETAAVVTMMTPQHPLWEVHGFSVQDYLHSLRDHKHARSVYSQA